MILGTVVIATIIPVVAFLAALERVDPTNAAAISNLEPVVTIFLAAFLFNERFSLQALFGVALILGAVGLLAHTDALPKEEHVHPARGAGRQDA